MQELRAADCQALEQYREPDGQLNVDRLVADFGLAMRRIESEAAQKLDELYPRSRFLRSQPVLSNLESPLLLASEQHAKPLSPLPVPLLFPAVPKPSSV